MLSSLTCRALFVEPTLLILDKLQNRCTKHTPMRHLCCLQNCLKVFADYPEEMRSMVANTDRSTITQHGLYMRDINSLPSQWGKGLVTFVGDSMHATIPNGEPTYGFGRPPAARPPQPSPCMNIFVSAAAGFERVFVHVAYAGPDTTPHTYSWLGCLPPSHRQYRAVLLCSNPPAWVAAVQARG